MIQTIDIANFIEEKLNANTLGKHFLVYADAGDMRNAKRCCEYKYYTNCLLEVISSSLTPIKNISFQTATVQVMFIIDMTETGFEEYGEEERKQSRNLIDVKSAINEMIETLNGTTITQEINEKTYTTTIVFSQPTDGQNTQIGEIAEALPIYLTMDFVFFESGVNANDCHIYVDGEDVFFTRNIITRVKTAEQNQMVNGQSAKSYVLIGGKSIDMTIPAINTEFGQTVMQDVLGDEINIAHCVRVETPLGNHNYICVLGNTSANMDISANVGFNVSLVECVPNLAKYGSKWSEFVVEYSFIQSSYLGETTIFWGDGTSDYLKNGGNIQHEYTDGHAKHTIRIFRS